MNLLLYVFGAGGLIVGGLATFFVTDYIADGKTLDAVQAEAVRQEKLCNAEIDRVQNRINTHALETVSAGNAAVISLVPTPDDPQALKALCQQETACRDRKVVP